MFGCSKHRRGGGPVGHDNSSGRQGIVLNIFIARKVSKIDIIEDYFFVSQNSRTGPNFDGLIDVGEKSVGLAKQQYFDYILLAKCNRF